MAKSGGRTASDSTKITVDNDQEEGSGMYPANRLFRWGAAWLVMSGVAVATAVGQVPVGSTPTRAVLIGRVIDTTGAAIADAEVLVTLGGDTSSVRRATSNVRGEVTFRDLQAGGPYTLLARKVGYGAAHGTDVHLKSEETLRVDFELPTVGVTLPTITATSRRGSRSMIAADEINAKKYPNVLDVIAWKRPYMLGDPDRCPQPQRPLEPTSNSSGMGRRPWVKASRFFDVFNPPSSPFVQRVYVNGVRIDIPGLNPLITLRDIPSDQIAEMRYVDCADQVLVKLTKDDTMRPVVWPGTIYIVLKATSQETQDSIIRRIRRR